MSADRRHATRAARGAPRPRPRLRGAASAEYTIATAAVIAALFLPLPGVGASAFDLVLDALQRFHANSTTLLSLP